MRIVYAFQCDVLPPAGRSVRQCMEGLTAEAETWLRQHLHLVGGEAAAPSDAPPVRAVWGSAAGRERAAIEWTYPDERDPFVEWMLAFSVEAGERRVALGVLIAFVSQRFHVNPFSPNFPAPSLVPTLVTHHVCQIDGQPVPSRHRVLPGHDVERFVRNQLANPRRALPAVLLSPEPVSGRPCLDPERLQERLLGFAEVVALADEAAVGRLTAVVGRERTCRGGAVRIYWPGFHKTADPGQHPFRLPEQLEKDAAAGVPAEQQLLGMFIAAAADRWCAARTIEISAEEAEAERAREAARAAEQEALRSASARLGEQLAAARRQVEELQSALTACRAELEAARAAPPRPLKKAATRSSARRVRAGEPERSFASIAEALAAAAAECTDVLSVWEDAEESARRSDSAHAGAVYRALRAVAEVGRLYFDARQAGRPMGPIDQALRSRIPFKYTATESPTTLSMFGQSRVFHHRGKSRQMLRHITLGRGDRKNCVQIYFEFNDETRRVEVGYCGKHLPISRQPT